MNPYTKWLNNKVETKLGANYVGVNIFKYIYLRYRMWRSDRATYRFNMMCWLEEQFEIKDDNYELEE